MDDLLLAKYAGNNQAKKECQIAAAINHEGSGFSSPSSVKIYYSSYDSLNEAKSTPGVIGTAASGPLAARLSGLLN